MKLDDESAGAPQDVNRGADSESACDAASAAAVHVVVEIDSAAQLAAFVKGSERALVNFYTPACGSCESFEAVVSWAHISARCVGMSEGVKLVLW